MIAALPMYGCLETALHNDIFYSKLGQLLVLARSINAHKRSLFVLDNEDLVLGQTCGLQYRKYLFDKVYHLATPAYSLNACLEGYYKSVFISRKEQKSAETSEGFFAFNEHLSQLGWTDPMCYREALDLCLDAIFKTGSHENSVHTIVEKLADFAAIDAQTWRLLGLMIQWQKSYL